MKFWEVSILGILGFKNWRGKGGGLKGEGARRGRSYLDALERPLPIPGPRPLPGIPPRPLEDVVRLCPER